MRYAVGEGGVYLGLRFLAWGCHTALTNYESSKEKKKGLPLRRRGGRESGAWVRRGKEGAATECERLEMVVEHGCEGDRGR